MTKKRGFMTGQLAARLAAEFVIIVAGVLVALGVDEWRQSRADAALEDQYLTRIIRDLRDDVELWQNQDQTLRSKADALDRALAWVMNPDRREEEVRRYLADLTSGARLAYGAMAVGEVATFTELLNTGRLGLITDVGFRRALVDYHRGVETNRLRMTSRETRYAPTIYELIPREPEFQLRADLRASDRLRIAERSLERDLEALIIAERNRARVRREIASDNLAEAQALLEQICRPAGQRSACTN